MSLGKNILTKRKEKNMTQEKLADCLGVSRQAVSDWERGIKKPETQNLIDLTNLLGTSLDWLCADELSDSKEALGKLVSENDKLPKSKTDGKVLKIAPVMLDFAEKLTDINAAIYIQEDKEDGQ